MQPASTPIIVKVVEESEITGLGNVMMKAVGLTGVIAIGALVFGLVLAALIIGYRKLRLHLEPEDEPPQTQPLGLTPTEEARLKSG
jgi:Na+/H+-dicarboxylate symporter